MSKSPALHTPGAATTPLDAPEEDKDAEIAALKAQLAVAQLAAAPLQVLVTEGNGPHNLQAIADSKHRHLTTAELHQQVMAGTAKLVDRHVLCKDGWYVNPRYVEGVPRA